jgi:phosphoribosylaminoimidazole-succinocarboxamide synthase
VSELESAHLYSGKVRDLYEVDDEHLLDGRVGPAERLRRRDE